jgi:nitrite reductase/ring-hydroxylating ferredoxin subunit
MAEFVKIAKVDEVAPGQGKLVEAQGKKIALFNVGGSFYAIDGACTHRGGPLSEGALNGVEVTCPWHGAAFDVTTGEVKRFPAPTGVASYPTRVEGGEIEIEI